MGVLGSLEPEVERDWKKGALPVKEESQSIFVELSQAGFPEISDSRGAWKWDEILGVVPSIAL